MDNTSSELNSLDKSGTESETGRGKKSLLQLSSQERLGGRGHHFDSIKLTKDLETKLGFKSIFQERNDDFSTDKTSRTFLEDIDFEAVENISRGDVKNVKHLVDGGMCRIFCGEFCERQCVVKVALPDHPNQGEVRNALEAELKVLRKVKHPNIVGYFGSGVTPEDGKLFIVLEKLEGSLADGMGEKTASGQRQKKLHKLDAMKWALEIALGMTYLHDEAIPGSMILHRDLKPDNICFGADGLLKIMDLGLAIIVDRSSRTRSEFYTMSGEVGSLRYMAPEVALNQPYNEKSDVYSFAMIFWEMLSGMAPFLHAGFSEDLKRRLSKGERPPLNKKWSQELRTLLERCWDQDMMSRPSFREVVGLLQAMIVGYMSRPPSSAVIKKNRLMQIAFGCLNAIK